MRGEVGCKIFFLICLCWTLNSFAGETINGIQVPPDPSPISNNSTLAGVDSDKNGIRDDIDRFIAARYGTKKTYFDTAVKFARTLQSAIVNPSPENTKANSDVISCIEDRTMLMAMNPLELAIHNTKARNRAFSTAFAGAVSGSCLNK